MNIVQLQNSLKNFADEQLVGEMKNPTGRVPQFLVLSEIKRRQDMRSGAATPPPVQSVAEERTDALAGEDAKRQAMLQGIGGMPEAGLRGAAVKSQLTGQPQMYAGGMIKMAGGGYIEDPLDRATEAMRLMRRKAELMELVKVGGADGSIAMRELERMQSAQATGGVTEPPLRTTTETPPRTTVERPSNYKARETVVPIAPPPAQPPQRTLRELSDKDLNSYRSILGPKSPYDPQELNAEIQRRLIYSRAIPDEALRARVLAGDLNAVPAPPGQRRPTSSLPRDDEDTPPLGPTPDYSGATVVPGGIPPDADMRTQPTPAARPIVGRTPLGGGGRSSSAGPRPTASASPPAEAGIAALAAKPGSDEPGTPNWQDIEAKLKGGATDRFGPLREKIDALYGDKEKRGRDSVNDALIEAGLAMASSKRGNWMQALGEGGIKGLATYREGKKEGRREDRDKLGVEASLAQAEAGQDSSRSQLAATLYSTEEQAAAARRKNRIDEQDYGLRAQKLPAEIEALRARAAADARTPAEIQVLDRILAMTPDEFTRYQARSADPERAKHWQEQTAIAREAEARRAEFDTDRAINAAQQRLQALFDGKKNVMLGPTGKADLDRINAEIERVQKRIALLNAQPQAIPGVPR